MDASKSGALLVVTLVLGACAGQPPVRAAHAPVHGNASKIAAMPPSLCLRSGTHLKLPEDECSRAMGRAYVRDDLDRTPGSVAEAMDKITLTR
jgi:hypothetical protein